MVGWGNYQNIKNNNNKDTVPASSCNDRNNALSSNNNNNDDDDLYNDLQDEIETKPSPSPDAKARPSSNSRDPEQNNRIPTVATKATPLSSTLTGNPGGGGVGGGVRSLVQEVDHLQKLVESLQEENQVLKCNIGILYRTARAESQRKNDLIEALQQ